MCQDLVQKQKNNNANIEPCTKYNILDLKDIYKGTNLENRFVTQTVCVSFVVFNQNEFIPGGKSVTIHYINLWYVI